MLSWQVSHKINELSFGAHFPGVVNPLDGVVNIQKSAHGMYQYFIKVVPTLYTDIRGHKIATNQVCQSTSSPELKTSSNGS
jgi:hypothetical protein